MIYFTTVFLLLILIWIYDVLGVKGNKMNMYYLVLVLLILTAGLRYRIGLDTIRYMRIFEDIPTILDLSFRNIEESRYDPLFYLLISISKSLIPEFVFFQILHAVILNSVIFIFIKKNTSFIFTGVLLYYIFCFTNFNFEVMRESLAVVFFLVSIPHLINRKIIKYYLLVLVAIMFHSSAFVLIFVPLFMKLKIKFQLLLYIIGVYFFSIFLKNHIAPIFEIISITDSISEKATRYIDSDILGSVLNFFGILKNAILFILLPILALAFLKRKFQLKYRYEFLIILNIFVTVIIIQFGLAYRFYNYFILFDIILFSECVGKMGLFVPSKFTYISVVASLIFVSFLPIYSYFATIDDRSSLKLYSRYYPYSSIISKNEDTDRERQFRFYNAY